MGQVAVTPRADSALLPVAVIAGVVAAAAAGWVVLAERMAGMDTGPGGDPGALGWFAATWAAMTAAMMLPAAAPAVVRVMRARDARDARAPAAAALFVAGYGAVWLLAGLAGYAVVQGVRGLQLGALAWSSAGRYVAGASVVAAGVYQLSATKRRWLARCTTPELAASRRGIAGPLLAGVEHGGCCVACCWTLMVALYALGMMSITWMVTFTLLIVSERLLPLPAHVVRAVAGALVVLGIALAALPAAVPALTIPSGVHAMTMPSQAHPMTMPSEADISPPSSNLWSSSTSCGPSIASCAERHQIGGRTAGEAPHRR
jgi:predicted metal-binding membrane protein